MSSLRLVSFKHYVHTYDQSLTSFVLSCEVEVKKCANKLGVIPCSHTF